MKFLNVAAASLAVVCAIPSQATTTLEFAKTRPDLTVFVQLVTASGLANDLQRLGAHTVLAPVNSTFEGMKPATIASMLANKSCLRELLLTHVLLGSLKTNGGDSVAAPFVFLGEQNGVNVPFRPAFFQTLAKTDLKGFFLTNPQPGEAIYDFTNYDVPRGAFAAIYNDGRPNETQVLSNGTVQPIKGLLLDCSTQQ